MRHHLHYAFLIAGLGGIVTAPHAQNYPAKTVRMIVPSAAGGSVDFMARLVSAKLSGSRWWLKIAQARVAWLERMSWRSQHLTATFC
jgi:tripartite-type tricarboxylate transporter receptor subunit TctC